MHVIKVHLDVWIPAHPLQSRVPQTRDGAALGEVLHNPCDVGRSKQGDRDPEQPRQSFILRDADEEETDRDLSEERHQHEEQAAQLGPLQARCDIVGGQVVKVPPDAALHGEIVQGQGGDVQCLPYRRMLVKNLA